MKGLQINLHFRGILIVGLGDPTMVIYWGTNDVWETFITS